MNLKFNCKKLFKSASCCLALTLCFSSAKFFCTPNANDVPTNIKKKIIKDVQKKIRCLLEYTPRKIRKNGIKTHKYLAQIYAVKREIEELREIINNPAIPVEEHSKAERKLLVCRSALRHFLSLDLRKQRNAPVKTSNFTHTEKAESSDINHVLRLDLC